MRRVSNLEIARLLEKVGHLLSIQGEDEFRALAYLRAAESVRDYPDSLHELVEQEFDLLQLEGVGSRISQCIHEMVTTGRLKRLEELARQVPLSLLEVLALRGVGPKSVRKFWRQLGIRTLAELDSAARAGKIARLKGFGEKSQFNLILAIDRHRLLRDFGLSRPDSRFAELSDAKAFTRRPF